MKILPFLIAKFYLKGRSSKIHLFHVPHYKNNPRVELKSFANSLRPS